MPPGLVSETLAPCRSSAVSLFSRALAIRSLKASRNCVKREPAGVADDRHHQRAPAVLLLDVDGDAEVDRAVVDHVRLAVDLGEVARHHRHLLRRRAGDRVGDQVREGDLVAGLLELLAAGVERRDGDRAERGRGRDGARLVHVAGEHRRRALEQRGAGGLGGRGGGRPFAPLAAASTSSLPMRPSGPRALDAAEVDAVGGGDALGHGRDARAVGQLDDRQRRRRGAAALVGVGRRVGRRAGRRRPPRCGRSPGRR